MTVESGHRTWGQNIAGFAPNSVFQEHDGSLVHGRGRRSETALPDSWPRASGDRVAWLYPSHPLVAGAQLPMQVRGRMGAGWAYSYQQAAQVFAKLSQAKVAMLVLALGGEKANGRCWQGK